MAELGVPATAALIVGMSATDEKSGMTEFQATWLVNVAGADGSERPAYCRISEDSAYRPDDTFVIGWMDEVEAMSVDDVPEMMWALHNADSRSSGETCRSMCMGDVVVVGERAYACEDMGFRELDEVPGNVEIGTYVEYMDTH
jgi:hypothetical protein